MKTRILDRGALSAISPAALRAYVVAEGWSKVDQFGEFSEVYSRPNNNGVAKELIVPFTSEPVDYALAVGEALKFLSNYEQRDELALYADLVRADRDVIRVRAPEADDDGSIAIDPGVEIVQHAQEMLASAACSALDPRRAYHIGKVHGAESRGGPGCLNIFSASISGVSARVRLPCGVAAR